MYFNLQYLWMKDWKRAQCREKHERLWLWPPCVLVVVSGYQVSEQQVIILMHCPSGCICLVHTILFTPCWLFEGGVLLFWGMFIKAVRSLLWGKSCLFWWDQHRMVWPNSSRAILSFCISLREHFTWGSSFLSLNLLDVFDHKCRWILHDLYLTLLLWLFL